MESKGRINNYEVMFLFSQASGSDLHNVLMTLNTIFERSSCEIIALEKWDERRLAYEVDKHKRGVYFLVYMRCDPANLAGFERDCNLSEDILRFMVTKADHLTEEEMHSHDQRARLGDEAQLRSTDVPAVAGQVDPEQPAESVEDLETEVAALDQE